MGSSMTEVTQPDWIECVEIASQRQFWYHRDTFQITFDLVTVASPKITQSQSLSVNYQIPSLAGTRNQPQYSASKRNLRTHSSLLQLSSPNSQSSNSSSSSTRKKSRSLCDWYDKDIPNKEVVHELLQLDSHPWPFQNDVVDVYRHRVNKVPHKDFLPDPVLLAFPCYYSKSPLPPGTTTMFYCSVKLPPESNPALTHTKVPCRQDTTTGDDVIQMALKKVRDAQPLQQYILKVRGREEYVYGTEPVLHYEHVRMALRNNTDVALRLVCLSDKDQRIEQFQSHQKAHSADMQQAYPPDVTRDDFLSFDDSKPPLTIGDRPWHDWPHIPASECNFPFRVKVSGVDNALDFPRVDWIKQVHNTKKAGIKAIFVKTVLYLGCEEIPLTSCSTQDCPVRDGCHPRWGKWLSSTDFLISSLPRNARLCYLVYGIESKQRSVLLGWAAQQVFDHRGRLLSGSYALPLWMAPAPKRELPQKEDLRFLARWPTNPNLARAEAGHECGIGEGAVQQVPGGRPIPILHVKFERFALDVVSSTVPPPITINVDVVGAEVQLTKKHLKPLKVVLSQDPLRDFTEQERDLVWRTRHHHIDDWNKLPVFLRCVKWWNAQHAAEARRLLKLWAQPEPGREIKCLELLDARFQDAVVREYAVSQLKKLPDSDLSEYIMQLVQALKYEPHHDSCLSRFMMERALRNPYQIGHFLFWSLKSELHNLDFCERYGLLLEEYLLFSGHHAQELLLQQHLIERYREIADRIAKEKHVNKMEKAALKSLLKKSLTELNQDLPPHFPISLNPRWHATEIIVDQCRFMSSKKVPLWLVMKNVDDDADPHVVMFKVGDDVRQDILTLQMLRVMDKIWLSEGHDMRMKPYSVVATGVNPDGDGIGFLEIVLNSATINMIHMEHGGTRTGALQQDPIDKFIKFNNEGSQLDVAQENFIRSCAGYCMATFVMGVGDRHSDNIMMTKAGHLFHIDFGHFLGNWKTKAGFKRERSPFVFTPEMCHAMGGKKSKGFKRFVEMCQHTYSVLRTHHRLLIMLFVLMQSGGMPELQNETDVEYMRDLMNLELERKAADKIVAKEVKDSMSDWYRRLDNQIHMLKHA